MTFDKLIHRHGEDPKEVTLRRVPVFARMTHAELAHIARLVDQTEAPAGKTLMDTGERAQELFIVIEGRAGVYVRDTLVGEVGPGEFVGEMAFLGGRGWRHARVVTLTPMSLFVLSPREADALLKLQGVATGVAIGLSERLGHLLTAIALAEPTS